MKKPYILHLPKWYPNAEDDLEGIFIRRHIESTKAHWDARVVFARAGSTVPSNRWYVMEEIPITNGMAYLAYYRHSYIGVKLLDRVIKFTLYYGLNILLIRKVVKRHGKPAGIHAHVLLRSAVLAQLFSFLWNVPFWITEHATFFTLGVKPNPWNLKNFLRKLICHSANGIITVSHDLEMGMKSFGIHHTRYFRVFNNVDTALFHYRKKSAGERMRFIHVSEFKNDHKNILGLLRVVSRLKEAGQNFVLDLVGYGADLSMILQFLQDHQLTDVVRYHGKIAPENLACFYQQAAALILFSNKENMPCVIAESLCCGTPVISTRVGGIAEIVDKNNGILIDKGSENQLFESICGLTSGKYSFDYQRISAEATQLFNNEAIGNRISQIYRGGS
ncbi:MAG TPA: glycosyltransferase [Saprospiraceae bacterium]|nr:glycosyltransferase [Saprospiraceae bacterium]